MITLKESILSRSSHGAKGFEAQRREMIEKWLDKYKIKNNYTINNDFTIDVDGFVYLNNWNLKELPEYIQFNIITGSFYCSENKLTSLRGCPREVRGIFNCSNNKLTSLEGAPKEVGSDFYCYNNQLTSLEGAPEIVKGKFNCSGNQLTSLKGVPSEVGKDFVYSNNKIQFTEEDVRRVCNIKGNTFIR